MQHLRYCVLFAFQLKKSESQKMICSALGEHVIPIPARSDFSDLRIEISTFMMKNVQDNQRKSTMTFFRSGKTALQKIAQMCRKRDYFED